MNAKKYLSTQIESMWYLQDSVCDNLDDGILMKMPPGTASPIGVIWLHMLNGQDNFVSAITGKPPLWREQGWQNKFGLENAPNIGEDWSKYESLELNIEILNDYSKAVREYTREVLAITDSGSLDETVKFFTESDPKANVWVLMVGHTLLHCGEIAAIKGIMGQKGLPF